MRAIDIAVSAALPEDLRQETYDLNQKGVVQLMSRVATQHPDKFETVAKRLGDLGRNAAWQQAYTINDQDLDPVLDRKQLYEKMDAEIAALRKQKLDPTEFNDRRNEVFLRYADLMEKETMHNALKRNNSWAVAAASGARGNAGHIRAILTTPGVFADTNGKVIPMFVRNSYSDGVRPAELLAGSYGARLAVVSTKAATAKGGDFGKQLVQLGSNYNITEKDCGTDNGIDLEPDDESLPGRILIRGDGVDAGSALDRQAIAALRKSNKPVIVRSPMTCRSRHGLCAKCAGLQADGKLPKVGDSLGVTAATAVREPIVQGSLNCLGIDELVRMADYTTKRIQDIAPGDWVLGADVHGDTFPVRVTAVWDQGTQPVQTYTYRLGSTKQRLQVTCTEAHPVLQITTYSGAKEEAHNKTPRKLPAGRKAGLPAAVMPRNHTPVKGLNSEPLAAVVGYFLGDGIRCVTTESGVKVSCACKDTAKDINAVLQPLGMHMTKLKRSHDWLISSSSNDFRPRDAHGRVQVGNFRSTLRNLVTALGLDGKYAHEKTLPEAIWGWDQVSAAAVVAGFVAADGSVYRNKDKAPGVSMSSSAKSMLDGFKSLLAIRFGIHSTAITCVGRAGMGNRNNDLWQFTITSRDQVRRFNDVIAPHIVGGKGNKLERYLTEAPPSKMARNPYYKARRVSIEDAGEQPCWDISVDHPDELFVLANGLIVKNTKHTAGMAKGKKAFAGFDYINQFVQIPDEFKDKATVAEADGEVEKIEPAAQGGNYITIGGIRHYTLPGFEVRVKPGDRVEAGEQLSEGLANPADIVRLRGLGEGRRYYADRFQKLLKDSGYPADRVNIEILAKAAVDNYRAEDPEDDDILPDSLLRENALLARYTPPEDTRDEAPAKAVGGYLQRPVLHYTVGTRITPKIAERIQRVGVQQVPVSRKEPWFKSDMVRLRTATHDSDDWLRGMGTSYLAKQLQQSLEAGEDTNVAENYHYGPRLAYGADSGKGSFGEHVEETGKF